MGQVLTWAMEQDPALALRLANVLGWWWFLWARLAMLRRSGSPARAALC